jgi:FPC/CPF motif-containing protein YcgG
LFSTAVKKTGAVNKIRSLLKIYDPMPISPELKNYGEPGSRESTQYFLLDENVPASCPFSMLGGEKPEAHP